LYCLYYSTINSNFNKFKAQGRKGENKLYIKTADIYGITEYSNLDQSKRP